MEKIEAGIQWESMKRNLDSALGALGLKWSQGTEDGVTWISVWAKEKGQNIRKMAEEVAQAVADATGRSFSLRSSSKSELEGALDADMGYGFDSLSVPPSYGPAGDNPALDGSEVFEPSPKGMWSRTAPILKEAFKAEKEAELLASLKLPFAPEIQGPAAELLGRIKGALARPIPEAVEACLPDFKTLLALRADAVVACMRSVKRMALEIDRSRGRECDGTIVLRDAVKAQFMDALAEACPERNREPLAYALGNQDIFEKKLGQLDKAMRASGSAPKPR